MLRTASLCGLGILAAILPGCNTVEGGGFVLSATGFGKATFGFYLECENNAVSGDMVYMDHPLGLKAQMVPDSTALSVGGVPQCGGQSGAGDFFGTYTPSPTHDQNGDPLPGGRFHVILRDTGIGGPSKGDTISIQFFGGVYDGYANNRPLLGGNIDRVE
jgi:hypothetical protein